MKSYLERIVDSFYSLDVDSVPDEVIHQIRRSLLDYLGCTIYTVDSRLCNELVGLVKSISAIGNSSIWGDGSGYCIEAAGFANAARTSNIELDDVSGMGASVHPGVYVWSALFASFEEYHPDRKTVLKAVLFGYDLCLRMGLLSTERVRELGLHGPGLNGAFAALATAGTIAGLTREEMMNAIGIAGSLLPLCPFISFTSGTDSKDFYGGWGEYLGLVAVNAAKRGMTGPYDILNGKKSLISIYSGNEADGEIAKDFLIMKIVFKEFSACASVHPAMTALLAIMDENGFSSSDVESISVETYPYSYALNSGVHGKLNVSSARLSLPYTISACIETGALMPDVFLKENLDNGRYAALVDRVEVLEHKEYGDSAFSVRGAIVTVRLKDGRSLRKEAIGNRWTNGATDNELIGKFEALSKKALNKESMVEIERKALSFDGDLSFFISKLKSL